jgi:hypothetical protein
LNESHIFSRYGGTRFLLSLGCGFVTTGLLVLGFITEGVWQVVILGTMGTFIAGNTVQNAASYFAPQNHYSRGNDDANRQY